MVFGLIMFADVMHLSMAVMTGGDAVSRTGSHDLLEFKPAISTSVFGKTGLQEAAAPAAAIIVGAVGKHVDKIFFTHNGFHDKPQIFRHWITKAFSDQLAGVLNRKLDFQVFVPIGIDLEFAFPDPLGIILDDALDFEMIRNIEFFQSSPDCKQFVPSLGVEPDFALQIIHGLGLDLDDVFPAVVFGQKQAIIFSRPPLGAICPVRTHQMQNFP